jgi:hypothetical protein
MKQTIRFMHFPKTAGTTVASTLLRVYGRKHFFAFSGVAGKDRERFLSLEPDVRRNIRLFIGHSMYETGLAQPDAAGIFTILREPVARVKSFIQHAAAGKSSYLKEYASSGSFSIDGFLASGNGELDNLQTKMLVNRDQSDSRARILDLGEEEAVRLAISRLLDGTIAFGIQEDFDAGWVSIWNALGRKPPLYAALNRKKTAARFEFTDAQLEKIRSLNQLDLKLYHAAKEEFQRRRESGQIPDSDVEAFKRRQHTYGKVFSFVWATARSIIKRPVN